MLARENVCVCVCVCLLFLCLPSFFFPTSFSFRKGASATYKCGASHEAVKQPTLVIALIGVPSRRRAITYHTTPF